MQKVFIKAPFGVNEKRFSKSTAKCKIYVSPAQYDISFPDFKQRNFICPPFNTTSERFFFDKNSFVSNISHRFYYFDSRKKYGKNNFYYKNDDDQSLKLVGIRLC